MLENNSEVARLLSQIRAEFEAAQRGMHGLSQGISQHKFITTRMENMHKLQEELQVLAGDETMMLVVSTLDATTVGSTAS